MTVKDVLEKVTCDEMVTPIWIYSHIGKDHTEFEYGDFVKGNVHPNYLKEEVERYEQGNNNGPVSIILKEKEW